MSRRRVAFVVQRCGREVNGGAEVHCLEIAREMMGRWDVEIITTCAVDYMTWEDYYPEGPSEIDGVPALRFRVDEPRNVRHFNLLSERALAAGSALTKKDGERWMQAQGPYSSRLLRYLEEHGDEYDAIIFFTYMYATTYYGLPLVQERAILAPLAHDEWPIYLPIWDPFFLLPQSIVFNTVEERHFLLRRFPTASLNGPVVGVGIRTPDYIDPQGFRRRFGLANPYVVYVGRIDPMKGCEQLLIDFARYKAIRPDDLMLVLVGREMMPVPPRPYLKTLGFVDDLTKFEAIAAAEALVMPSSLESLSLVLLEAWSQRRPTLSNAASDVLVGQSKRANAGLWYTDSEEFICGIDVLRDTSLARELGENGAAFVEANYSWTHIAEVYEEMVERVVAGRAGSFAGITQ